MVSDYEVQDGFGYREGENSLGMDAEEQELWKVTRGRFPEVLEVLKRRDARRLREHNERKKEQERQAWARTEAGQLLKKLGECFAEYRDCVAKEPELEQKGLEYDAIYQKIFNKMKRARLHGRTARRDAGMKSPMAEGAGRRASGGRNSAICT